MTTPPFATLADLLTGWSGDVLHGRPPARWPAGPGPLARFPVGPGLVCLVGGPPGAGKTVLGNQLVFDAVRLTPHLRALVTCCEMPPVILLDRQLARLSGVPYSRIRDRALTDADRAAAAVGFATLAEVGDRVGFYSGPFEIQAVSEAADAIDADLILVDYLQRLQAAGPHKDKRSATNAILDTFRQFADTGRGLLVLSSVGRQPSGKHGKSSYDGLGLASFKESGDIEFSADDAFILPPAADGLTDLRHVKARHTERRDIPLRCELDFMRFDPVGADAQSGLLDAAQELWGNAPRRGVRGERQTVGGREAPARVRGDPPDAEP